MKEDVVLNELARMLEMDRSLFHMNFSLAEHVNLDSLTIISLIAVIDEQYGVLLKADEIEQCEKVVDIFKLINLQFNQINVA
jgi:acyl carrier protein